MIRQPATPAWAAALGERVAAGPIGRSAPGRAIAADRRWLLPIALVVYVLYVTWAWEFPNWQGIPFPPVWLGAAVTGLAGWHLAGRRLDAITVAAIVAVTAMLATDVTIFWSQPIRDLELYLKAGDRWVAGEPVYATVPLAERPEDLSDYPFLYPPVTLPLFGALGLLPLPVVAVAWVAASVAAVLAAARCIGLGWRWAALLLAWPPVAQGVYVGNVAIPLFAVFAAAAWRPGLLVVPPIFKVYSGIASLWLLRREHWRELAVSAAVVVGACALTLPLVGVDGWFAWFDGLATYQVSQRLLPEYLYGFGLARYVPLLVLVVLGAIVTVFALRARGRREQLSRLGVATVVASPSLFSHGWLVALPAMLRLDTPWFWLAFGLTACSPGLAWFGVVLVVTASWFSPAMRKRRERDGWHPLGAAAGPWPGAAMAGRPAARGARSQVDPDGGEG